MVIALIISWLLLVGLSSTDFTTSKILSGQGVVQYITPGGFMIRAANTPLDTITPGAASYQANWASFMKDTLGLNTLRLMGGGEGPQLQRINMIDYPNEWATNLDALLQRTDSAGLKVYFYSLGDMWGGELIKNDQAADISSVMSLIEAKGYIDRLGGANALNHNFLADPRILMWSVGNEIDFGSASSPNANYYWVIGICDYIRSYGGKVTVPYARLGGWDQYFAHTEPMLRGHVDYLETHLYGIWQLATYYSLGSNQYNWDAWKAWLKTQLQIAVDYRGAFDLDHVLLGEFGMWRGSGTDSGLTAYTFTDQNRVDYYTHYFEALREVGFKNACFHYAIEENSQYGNSQFCRYGMITPVPDGLHFTGPAGQPYPGAEVIKANFG
jgi:hypothetical protein